jgi:hypothetical protein
MQKLSLCVYQISCNNEISEVVPATFDVLYKEGNCLILNQIPIIGIALRKNESYKCNLERDTISIYGDVGIIFFCRVMFDLHIELLERYLMTSQQFTNYNIINVCDNNTEFNGIYVRTCDRNYLPSIGSKLIRKDAKHNSDDMKQLVFACNFVQPLTTQSIDHYLARVVQIQDFIKLHKRCREVYHPLPKAPNDGLHFDLSGYSSKCIVFLIMDEWDDNMMTHIKNNNMMWNCKDIFIGCVLMKAERVELYYNDFAKSKLYKEL